jgi:imidazolonepropionase-like amidohydrolase
MVSNAIEAGVAVYAGSDAGGLVDHGRLVDETEALHHAGMSPSRRWPRPPGPPASGLGHPGIADGAPADLLVFDTDPRQDLGVLRHPQHILLRGTVLS